MRIFIYILAVMLAFGSSSCINEDVPSKADVVHVGDALPTFSVTMNNGEVVSSDELRAKVSVVVFFHTSCKDCQQLLPGLF